MLKTPVGVPEIKPPETEGKTKAFDRRCDTWLTGVLFYMILTQDLMFDIKLQNGFYDKSQYTISKYYDYSLESIKLISDICRYDFNERLTPEQLLDHEYFSLDVSKLPTLRDRLRKKPMMLSVFGKQTEELTFSTREPDRFNGFYQALLQEGKPDNYIEQEKQRTFKP